MFCFLVAAGKEKHRSWETHWRNRKKHQGSGWKYQPSKGDTFMLKMCQSSVWKASLIHKNATPNFFCCHLKHGYFMWWMYVCMYVCIWECICVCRCIFYFWSVDLLKFLSLFRWFFSKHPRGSMSSSPRWSKSLLRSRRPRSSLSRSSRSRPSGRQSYGWASWRRTAEFCERARSTSPLFTTSRTQSWSRSATSGHLT